MSDTLVDLTTGLWKELPPSWDRLVSDQPLVLIYSFYVYWQDIPHFKGKRADGAEFLRQTNFMHDDMHKELGKLCGEFLVDWDIQISRDSFWIGFSDPAKAAIFKVRF